MLLRSRRLLGGSGGALELVDYSYADTNGASATSLVVPKPTDVLAGDLLVALLAATGGTVFGGDTGWVAEYSPTNIPAWLRSKDAGGSEPANYTFTSSNSRPLSATILCFREALWDGNGTYGTATTTNPVVANGFTMGGEGLLIGFYVAVNAGRTFAAPLGMTAHSSQSADAPSTAVFTQEIPAGATGSRSSTPVGSGVKYGVLFGITGS